MQKDTFNLKTIFRSFLNAFNIERGFIPTVRDLLIRPKQVVDYLINWNEIKYYLATLTALVSLITVTFTCPGYVISF